MKKETSLIFTGDIGFDKYMAGRWEDEELIAPEVLKFLRNTDHLIVNVEGPLSAGNKPADGTGMRNPEAAADKGGGSDTSTKG